MRIPPVNPDLPAFASATVWIDFRAVLNVSAPSTCDDELFSADAQRFKLIFGMYVIAGCTKSVADWDWFFFGQTLTFSITFDVNFTAFRTEFE